MGHLLAHPRATLENLPEVLKIYQKIRLPLAAKAAERSRTNGLIYEFSHPDLPVGPKVSAADLKPLGAAIGTSFEWLAKGGCDDDWKVAEERLLALSTA